MLKQLNKSWRRQKKNLQKSWKRQSKRYSRRLKEMRATMLTGLAFVIIGLAVFGVSLLITWFGQRSSVPPVSQVLKNNPVAVNPNPVIKGTPVHIVIPSVDIDLQIVPGYYYPSTQSWTLTLNDAQWATMTAPANDRDGLTFIYAHYRRGVFLTLPKVQPGATAIITTDNGKVFTYTFRSSAITTPEDTSLFSYKGKPVLMLQTCTGVHFQNRQLFLFDFTKVA
ncbi:MAG TPA: sortase [Candidatus Saccharimonadales bacterium]|nr:sortase [Candidatus Saccharimonadales bacterium]